MIDSYSFGHIVINGRSYSSDVVIHPDGTVADSWWRAAGHSLVFEDIRELVKSEPEIIVAGTGASGMMKPSPDLEGQLKERGIAFHALPTTKAVELFNRYSSARRVGGCFHLTC